MNPLLNIVVLIATGAVAAVLILGLRNMARGGNPNTSQLLMRWRIGLQFIAILVILAVLYVTGR